MALDSTQVRDVARPKLIQFVYLFVQENTIMNFTEKLVIVFVFLGFYTFPAFSCGGALDVACNVGKAIEKGAQDTRKAIEKGAQDTGKTIEKGVQDTGKVIEKGADDAGKSIEKAFQDTGAELEIFFKRVCEDWLNIPDGECSICYTSEGGDGNGEVYACKGGDPNAGIPPSSISKPTQNPSNADIEELDKWVKANRITHEELWPWNDGLSRFLPSKTIIGSPLPESMKIISPTKSGEIRQKDGYGQGYFLAPRAVYNKSGSSRIGTRYHGGVDFVTKEGGELIVAPISGILKRVSKVYKTHNKGLRAIVIENSGYNVKLLYVNPTLEIFSKVGQPIKQGTPIGYNQDLSIKFGNRMTNHVHMTILDPNKRRVSPDKKWVIKPRK